jgi:hypothetical protein
MALQIRRGPTVDRTGKLFAEGELVYDTQEKAIYIGDGTTLGGKAASSYTDERAVDAVGLALVAGTGNVVFTYGNTEDTANRIDASITLDGGLLDVVADTSPQLGGDLDLNTRNITGTGNVNITGTVTATGFAGPLTGNVTGSVSGNAGTVTNGVYTSDSFYIGTEQISIARASNPLTLNGVSISGNAGGNAATSTKLAATKNIQGVPFDGSADVTVITQGTGVTVTGTEVKIGQAVATTSDVTFNDVTVSGNLTVNGTSTTLNVTTLDVEDLNITVAKGAVNAAAANGAGLTVDGANATLLYANTGDKFVFNKPVDATSFGGNLTGNVTGNVTGNLTGTIQTASQTNITSIGTLTGLTSTGIVNVNYTGNQDSSIVVGGSNTKGGAGFHDFLRVTNGAVGATDGSKWFRIDSAGILEIVNSEYSNAIFKLSDSGTMSVNNIVVSSISTTSIDDDGILFNNTVTGSVIRATEEFFLGTGDSDFTMSSTTTGTMFNRPIEISAVVGQAYNIKTTIQNDRTSFGVPVQFGRYTTSQRTALSTVVAVTGATGTGTVVTLTFKDQAQEIFDVGAIITIADIISVTGNYNGTFTVTATTKNTVSYAHTANGTYGGLSVPPALPAPGGGVITGPVPNGTVVYDKDLHKFYGYADKAWFQFAATV